MLCCINPDCLNPLNPDGNSHCQACDTPLISLLRGHYRIIKVLSNEGGFGRTYLAEDIDKLNEKCVVKQLAPKTQEPKVIKKAIELFKQEAKQLQQLGEHHQIPSLIAYFEQDNYLYLVQQYIEGLNLLKDLQTQGTYSETKIKKLLLDLLPVLKYIHVRGVIHRDVKPQNIIRRVNDGKFVLIDFGASKQLTATVQTKIGTAIGSHGYTAPEQLQNGQAYPASDLYSLGVTCFYMLTGISPTKLWMEHGFGWITDWRRHIKKDTIPSQELCEFLDKLLKADIQKRYQSTDEAQADLIGYTSTYSKITQATPTKLTQQTLLNNLLKNQLSLFGVIVLFGLGIGLYSQLDKFTDIEFSQDERQTNTSKNLAPKTLRGHSSDVNSVAFAPDGQMFASASDDKTIKLWNPLTGQEIRTLQGHANWVWTIAFSPDGKILASAGADKTIKLWDVATGEQIRTLQGHIDGVTCIAFSPDGKQLASSSYDKTIKLWNVSNGKEIRTLKGHSQVVDNVIFGYDGVTLASGSWDKTIKLWNLTTGSEIRTLKGHSDYVLSIAFDPKGVMLASGSNDKTIKIWNLVTGELVRTLKGHTDKVNSVTFATANYSNLGSNEMLVSASNDNTIKLWNPATGKKIRTFKQDSGFIYSVAISPDGHTLASGGSADNVLKIWSIPFK
jgi:WD40 repeat protein